MPADSPSRTALVERLLVTGLAPNRLFSPDRQRSPRSENLGFYVCTIIQPLDEHWRDSPACLSGEADWSAYHIPWGVLAASETEAGKVALEWQARCYPLPAEIEEIRLDDDGFTDHPGVVWQGIREPYMLTT